MRILNVENDPAAAKGVALMLQGVAEECRTTTLGEQGVELARRQGYDLILLDLMLPDIDGYEVLRRLRALGIATPCLVVSALVDRGSDFGGLALGVGDYLVKPFSREELLARIDAVLDRAKVPAGLEEDLPPADDPYCGPVEQRRFRRFRTIKTARIAVGGGVDCKILNLSHAGASIRLASDLVELPASFMLELEGGTGQVCKVVWRLGDRVGVKFLGRTS